MGEVHASPKTYLVKLTGIELVSNQAIQLIVGLGNPGPKYEQTRHNVGFWFVDDLARQLGIGLRAEGKFQGETGKASLNGREIRLLKPTTYMNNSGQSVGSLAHFYRIPAEAILVVHDELDLPCGVARLKKGGGHGGHNGLRDIIAHLGTKEFRRLRIGIDHPRNSREVVNYVLKPPSREQREDIERALADADAVLSQLVAGEIERAMHALHSK